jgi:hypothetical protein
MAVLRGILAMLSSLLGLALSIPIIIMFVVFGGIAYIVRHSSRLFASRVASWEGIIEYDPYVGWKPKPNLDAYCSFIGGTFRIATDSEGWRGDSDLRRCQIVALGDSVAFGFGVNDEHAFFSLLNSGLRVKAIGSPGYNMVQGLLWLEKLSPLLRGKLVVWFICLGNDLYDNLVPNLYHYRMPFIRQINGTKDWEVVTSHIKKARWPFNPEHNSRVKEKWQATFTDRLLGQRAYSACEFLIRRAQDLCRETEAHLIVMTVPLTTQLDQSKWERAFLRYREPKQFDPNLPDRKIGEICAKLNLAFLSGKDYLESRDHIPEDGHWNERGHRRMAKLLETLYRDHVVNGALQRKQACISIPQSPQLTGY